jgi:tetratricopeptide (TPR) repeat protein
MADQKRPSRPSGPGRDRKGSRPPQRGGRSGPPSGGQRRTGPSSGPSRERPVRSAADQATYDGPPIPEDVSARELDPAVTSQLKGLPEKLAARVARHLAAAQRLVDEDPETAYAHTKAARARAARLAVVREANGEAAYAAGHYEEALADLRAAKRMNGATAYLPIMADCHRALGRADQAVKLAQSPSVKNFPPPAKAEMTLVESGARRDMGQLDAALRVLEQAPLTSKSREPWVTRLRYAYADTLEAAGREDDALAWFHRTHAIDGDQITDAEERASAIEARRPE